MSETRWRSVSIPRDLADQVDELVKVLPGYSSLGDFARDAIREKIEDLRKQRVLGELF